MNRASTAKVRLLAVEGDTAARRTDSLAVEEPLEIRCAGPGQKAVRVAVTMRTMRCSTISPAVWPKRSLKLLK